MADWPSVNFDWLANLPARMDEARISQVRQSLGNIDLNSPKALSNAASRLAAAGDLESAQKFSQLSSQRMTAEAAILSAKQRGLDVQLWEKYMQGKGAPGATPAETTADVSIGPPKTPAPPPVAPGPSWLPSVSPNPPSAAPSPGPRSDLPPGILPPNPSEEILAKAEGQGPQAPVPGPQLAGPPPGPPAPAGPPMMPPTPGVGFLPPQQGVPQLGSPPAPPVPSRAGMPIKPSDQIEGQATEVRVGKELMQMPPRSAGWPAFQMFKQKFSNALAQQKLLPEESAYQQDQVQRAYLGEGPQTRQEWASENKTRESVFGAAHKVYTATEDANSKSTELLGTLRRMDEIRKDPNFIQGSSAHDYASFMSGIASLASIAGVPLTTGESVGAFRARINKIAEPWLKSAALVEEFDAISKRALLAHVGSFAKSFSEGDRLFTEKIFAQITQSPGGIGAVIGDLRLMAEHAQGVARAARAYMSNKEPGSKATEWGLRQAISDYNDKNPLYTTPDGSLTPAGERLQAKAESGPQAGSQGGPPGPARPPRHPQAGFIVKDKQGKPVGTIDDSGTFVPSSGRGL